MEKEGENVEVDHEGENVEEDHEGENVEEDHEGKMLRRITSFTSSKIVLPVRAITSLLPVE